MLDARLGLVPIEEADDLGSYGAKALSLARLKRAGLPVPDAFCIRAEVYREHVRIAGVDSLIDNLHRLPDDSPPSATAPILHRVRAALKTTAMNGSLLSELRSAWESLGRGAVSVRSSVAAEDRAKGPLVSGHGTYFEPGFDEAVHAVRHCWSSLWGDDVWHRLTEENLNHRDLAVAVVLQHLVPAQASGIAFTADPKTGNPSRIVIESCFGLGEAIAAGKVPPDRFVLDRQTMGHIGSTVSSKNVQIVLDDRSHIAQRVVPPDLASEPSLSSDELDMVARAATEAERVVGKAACVEWALADGIVWLLQARPVVVGL